MIVFNGVDLANQREEQLKQKIATDFFDKKLVIAAVLFTEDAGSNLYTRLKGEAADRVGISYQVHQFSLKDSPEKIQTKLEKLNLNLDVTGIIIQKPWRKTWIEAKGESFAKKIENQKNPKQYEREQYSLWWNNLTSKIAEHKDVDGLHPITIAQIKDGSWQENNKVLPATCQAVLTILKKAENDLSSQEEARVGESKKIQNFTKGKYIILGKSDLLGIPLFYELKRQGKEVEILASKELKERMMSGQKLLDASVVVSATGRKNLVTGDMVSDNVVVVDVGEPRADVDFESVSQKAAFITPVPGGVGPMTVVSLLENCVELSK